MDYPQDQNCKIKACPFGPAVSTTEVRGSLDRMADRTPDETVVHSAAARTKNDPRRTLHHPEVSLLGARRVRPRASSRRIAALPEFSRRGSPSRLEAVRRPLIPAGLPAGTNSTLEARSNSDIDLSQNDGLTVAKRTARLSYSRKVMPHASREAIVPALRLRIAADLSGRPRSPDRPLVGGAPTARSMA